LSDLIALKSVSIVREKETGTFAGEPRFAGMGDGKKSCAVLVVEDEPLVRMIAVELLQDVGLEVCEAGRADEAIPVLEAPNEIRVLFTDVRMPGSMNGYALAHYVHGRWPGVKIIVTSGHTRVREDSLPTGAVFMPKPYDPALLRRRIKEMVAA
jgi:DNA-binding NtrC family response regulator